MPSTRTRSTESTCFAQKTADMALIAPVPFYVSSKGYGVFIDSARYISFNVGVSVRLAARLKPPVIDRTTGKGWSSSHDSDVKWTFMTGR
jgi:alpha-glucosidase (family GH31 glycosyl hydrolase)